MITRTQARILIGICLALTAWRIFEIPAVANAFWQFCTVGALPGTDYIVPPDTTLRSLCIVFALSILLIFRKEFIASLPRRSSQLSHEEVISVKPARVAKVAAHDSHHKQPVIVIRSGRKAPASVWKLPLAVMGTLFTGLIQLVSWLEQQTETGLRRIQSVWLSTVAGVTPYLYIMVQWVAQMSKRLWRVTKPYLQEFDRWLERKVSRNRAASDILEILGECLKIIPATMRKRERYTRKLP